MHSDIKKIFSKRLKNLLKSKNLTQSELGRVLDLSRPEISNYVTGRHVPSLSTAVKISDFFNVSIDYLFREKPIDSINSFLPMSIPSISLSYSEIMDIPISLTQAIERGSFIFIEHDSRLKNSLLYSVQINDDSLNSKEYYCPKGTNLVVISKNSVLTVRSGNNVIALIHNSCNAIARTYIDDGINKILYSPNDKKYPPIQMENSIEIAGVVVKRHFESDQ